MRHLLSLFLATLLLAIAATSWAADIVPTDIMQPGTQPNEVSNLESPDKCDNCHGGYDRDAEPAFQWRGSAMGNAGRDPFFGPLLPLQSRTLTGLAIYASVATALEDGTAVDQHQPMVQV
jgi:hypothetical protein